MQMGSECLGHSWPHSRRVRAGSSRSPSNKGAGKDRVRRTTCNQQIRKKICIIRVLGEKVEGVMFEYSACMPATSQFCGDHCTLAGWWVHGAIHPTVVNLRTCSFFHLNQLVQFKMANDKVRNLDLSTCGQNHAK